MLGWQLLEINNSLKWPKTFAWYYTLLNCHPKLCWHLFNSEKGHWQVPVMRYKIMSYWVPIIFIYSLINWIIAENLKFIILWGWGDDFFSKKMISYILWIFILWTSPLVTLDTEASISKWIDIWLLFLFKIFVCFVSQFCNCRDIMFESFRWNIVAILSLIQTDIILLL